MEIHWKLQDVMDEEGEEEEAPPAPYQQERPILLSALSEKNRLENFHKFTNQLQLNPAITIQE